MNSKQLIAFLSVLVVIAFAWGFYQTSDGGNAATVVENDRQRAFYELVDSVENMAVLSSKALLSTGDSNRAKLYAQLTTESYVAQENLNELPVAHEALTRTQQFLNQMGNFSYSLIAGATRGEPLSEEQEATMASLNTEVQQIANALHNLAGAEENPFSWQAIKASTRRLNDGNLAAAGLANSTLNEVNTGLDKVETLIYDGPFSDHLEAKGPVALPGEEIGWDQAIATAKSLFGDAYTYEKVSKTSAYAGIAVLTVGISGQDGQGISGWLDVSKVGGYPVQLTSSTGDGEIKISAEEALQIAAAFLAKTPYQSMRDVYYLIEDNVLTANYVYTESDAIFYPDMVKVSVNLATGQIVGFDAINYLTNHYLERSLSGLNLTEEAAAAALTTEMTPASVQKAVIPLENGAEALCYEFRFDGETQSWLVYINAKTGEETDILGVYTTSNGTFTL